MRMCDFRIVRLVGSDSQGFFNCRWVTVLEHFGALESTHVYGSE